MIREDELIARIRDGTRTSLSSAGLRLGIGDDAAVWAPRPGYETILTCDWFLEGAHFRRDIHLPEAVGWKCLARAVSDIAAMGGEPRCFLLSLALPSYLAGPWLKQFLNGLNRAAKKFRCALAGGDTTRYTRINISVTVVGEVRAGRAVLRSGARPGDIIFVSGRLGEAELGWWLLREGKAPAAVPLVRKHLYPEPRLALGRWLAEKRMATAMMDISDGLSSDLPRLCAASGVGARIEEEKLPAVSVPEQIKGRRYDRMALALDGGDDYEMLFTVRRGAAARVPRSFKGLKLSAIGEVTRARKVVLMEQSGRATPLVPRGWDPFREKW